MIINPGIIKLEKSKSWLSWVWTCPDTLDRLGSSNVNRVYLYPNVVIWSKRPFTIRPQNKDYNDRSYSVYRVNISENAYFIPTSSFTLISRIISEVLSKTVFNLRQIQTYLWIWTISYSIYGPYGMFYTVWLIFVVL